MFDILKKKKKDWSKKCALFAASTASHKVLCSTRTFYHSSLNITYRAISITILLSTVRYYPSFMCIWVLYNTLQHRIPRLLIPMTDYLCSGCKTTRGRSVCVCTSIAMFGQECVCRVDWMPRLQVSSRFPALCRQHRHRSFTSPSSHCRGVAAHDFNYPYLHFLWVIPPLHYLC